MAVITSPGRRPACAAALCGSLPGTQSAACFVALSTWKFSLTQVETLASFGADESTLVPSGRPTNTTRIHSVTNARTKWATDPADMTTVRFHTGNRHIARFSSPG